MAACTFLTRRLGYPAIAWALLIGHGSPDALAQGARLLRDPSISLSRIAFAYAGNIWIANRDGSAPRRLTDDGHSGKPKFSPDGSRIAYTVNGKSPHSGFVYVVNAAGGEPRRLTYHPADQGAVGWTPDGGQVLFSSARASLAPNSKGIQLFAVPASGGAVITLPLNRAAEGSMSADGLRMAYVPNVRSQPDWKMYRGGQSTPIRIVNLASSTVEAEIPRDNSNDFNPIWIADTVYFLSDRSGPVTLFAYDVKSRQIRKIVENVGLDLKSAAGASDAIVYEQFGSLHVLDLKSHRDRVLNVRPVTDLPETRPHMERLELSQSRSAALAPTGKSVAFGMRGEILTVSVADGAIRNLTRTTGAVERDPVWSPDGSSIAYFSDESGEYALHVRDPSGAGPITRIGLGEPPSFYYSPAWSPDGTKIAYTDKRLDYWYVNVKNGKPIRVDTDFYVDPRNGPEMVWSPDNQWIAYTRQLKNHLHAVFLYSLQDARSYQLTDGMSDALHVDFDKSGTYLYFTASTDAALQLGWVDWSGVSRPVTRAVYAVLLRRVLPAPISSETAQPKQSAMPDSAPAAAGRPSIELDEIAQRIVALPIPARNYYALHAGKPGVIFLVEGPEVDPYTLPYDPDGPATRIQEFDLASRRMTLVLDGAASFKPIRVSQQIVPSFQLSHDGASVLYARDGRWHVASVGPGTARPIQLQDSRELPVQSAEVYVDPRAEWAHMYQQVWRGERDFFYDPGVNGLSLPALEKKYERYLAGVATRDDLTYLFREMLSNIANSHLSVSGPDSPGMPSSEKSGFLGAQYCVDSGRYRISEIYANDTWSPALRSPLAEPGTGVQVGDYLLAVNGRDIRPSADVHSYFMGTAGAATVLTVSRKSDGTGARNISVMPIDWAGEAAIRQHAWIEQNRRKVEELTHGRVAYVYLEDTSSSGYSSFNRYYFAQAGKEAAIIDVRYNRGGNHADAVIDNLRRTLYGYNYTREGHDISSPIMGIFGPKVLLTNAESMSGADWLAFVFRDAGIGPLVGTRTWGGCIGNYTGPNDLLDGGAFQTPNFENYDKHGSWGCEGRGVAPDIKIDDSPGAARAGHDLQLEKAVEVVMKLLASTPPATIHRPPFPNYESPHTTGSSGAQ